MYNVLFFRGPVLWPISGQLITEIQIGQRMLGIIESSARYAQEAAARQRQQTYDNDWF